jgi:hypothetical protein
MGTNTEKTSGVTHIKQSSQVFPLASVSRPASHPMGTGGPFPGVKRGLGMALITHPHLVPRSRMSKSCTFSPLGACMAIAGQF